MTKPTKWHVRPKKTQISLGIRPVWSGFAVRLKKHWALKYLLSGCPGWSESLLSANAILLVVTMRLIWCVSNVVRTHECSSVYIALRLQFTSHICGISMKMETHRNNAAYSTFFHHMWFRSEFSSCKIVALLAIMLISRMCVNNVGRSLHLSRLVTKPTKWHVRPAKT